MENLACENIIDIIILLLVIKSFVENIKHVVSICITFHRNGEDYIITSLARSCDEKKLDQTITI